jgi:C1A family cysteine protease
MERIHKLLRVCCFLCLAAFITVTVAVGIAGAQNEVVYLNEQIAEEHLEWTAGETSVSQMSLAERQALLGGLPTPAEDIDPARIWNPPARFSSEAALPGSYDLRNYKVAGRSIITPVKNQLSCGSCWAFSAVANLEALGRRAGKNRILSEQTVLNCSDGNCGGWYLNYTFDFLVSDGTDLKSDTPYKGVKGTCKSYDVAAKAKSWVWINGSGTSTNATDNAIRSYIYNQKKPVSCRMEVYDSFFYYNSGVYKHIAGEYNNGGHFVLIVGWGKTSSGTKYWVCKNSWGTGFGLDGYFKIKVQDSVIGTYAIGATLK